MEAILRAFPIAIALAALGSGCSTTYPRADPTGKVFPSIRGSSLDGKLVEIPAAFAGRPALLFIGYEQMSQFDIDRWLLGLRQSGIEVPAYELPAIPGLVPGIFAGKIDAGMRSGIPAEDWASVITVYGDASKVAEFVGNENGLPARVVLLDAAGKVVYFHDDGYSVKALEGLGAAVSLLAGKEGGEE